MFEELKKKSIKKSLFATILCFILGIASIAYQIPNVQKIMKGREAFEKLKPDEIKEGILVDATIDMNFGAFMEYYEKNTSTNYERTTDLYYVIITGEEDDEDFCFMGMRVDPEYMRKMDDMAEATYYEEATTPIKFSGEIKRMNTDEYKYFKEFMVEGGLTSEDIEMYTLPYYIDTGSMVDASATIVWVGVGIGILFIAYAIFRLVYALKGGNLNKLRKEIANSGYTEERVASDYTMATSLNKSNDMKVGRTFTFYTQGAKPHIIVNDNIVWVYQKTTTHRTNGIKTGTTYSLLYYFADKKSKEIPVDSEQAARQILQIIDQCIPRAVVGYTDELNRMYRREYDNFLRIRYNNPEYNRPEDNGFNTSL